jgi:hypothetical protein
LFFSYSSFISSIFHLPVLNRTTSGCLGFWPKGAAPCHEFK